MATILSMRQSVWIAGFLLAMPAAFVTAGEPERDRSITLEFQGPFGDTQKLFPLKLTTSWIEIQDVGVYADPRPSGRTRNRMYLMYRFNGPKDSDRRIGVVVTTTDIDGKTMKVWDGQQPDARLFNKPIPGGTLMVYRVDDYNRVSVDLQRHPREIKRLDIRFTPMESPDEAGPGQK